jgi:hypothetical protein
MIQLINWIRQFCIAVHRGNFCILNNLTPHLRWVITQVLFTGLLFTPCAAQVAGDHFEHIWPKSMLASFDDMQFVTESVWIAFDEVSGIYRTDDSGHTWRKIPVYSAAAISSVYFINPQLGLAGDAGGRILRTEDGGTNWRVVFQDTGHLLDSTAMPLRLKQFAAPDKHHIYLLANYRYLFHSSNKGKSWKRHDTQHTAAELFHIRFVSPKVGYIFANKTLLQTTNGGAEWDIINNQSMRFFSRVGVKYQKLDNDIFYWNENYAYYRPHCHDDMSYTVDGGRKWTWREWELYDSTGKKMEIPEPIYVLNCFSRAAFADSLFGIMSVYNKGRSFIGYTTDGGHSVRQIRGLVSNGIKCTLLRYNPKGG